MKVTMIYDKEKIIDLLFVKLNQIRAHICNKGKVEHFSIVEKGGTTYKLSSSKPHMELKYIHNKDPDKCIIKASIYTKENVTISIDGIFDYRYTMKLKNYMELIDRVIKENKE